MIDVAMLRWDGIEQTVSALIDCSWVLRGCPCGRLGIDETNSMFSGYIVMATAKRQARPFRDRVTRRSIIGEKANREARLYKSPEQTRRTFLREVPVVLNIQLSKIRIHDSALVMQHPGGITCRGNASIAVPAKRPAFSHNQRHSNAPDPSHHPYISCIPLL